MTSYCMDCKHSLQDPESGDYFCFHPELKQESMVTGEIEYALECSIQRKREGTCKYARLYSEGKTLYSWRADTDLLYVMDTYYTPDV